MIDSDAIAVTVTATGEAYAGPIRVKQFVMSTANASGGTLTLRDGGVTGDVIVKQVVSEGTIDIPIPVGGLRFRKSVHATLTDLASVTLYMA